MQSSKETFQIPPEVAEAYEAKFVPALFAEWASQLVDFAAVSKGESVLDVACGTGIVARTAADRMGAAARVVGVDLNESMLTVARRVRPDVEWKEGDAAELPFPDQSFDVVLCQMALMFFPDRAKALREMTRVAKAGGRVAVVVPSRLDLQPAYAPFVEMAAREAGPEARSLLTVYFVCGDRGELEASLVSAGLSVIGTKTHRGISRFDSVDEFVETEVESTPLIGRITGEVYQRIREGAREVLRPFATSDGRVGIPLEGCLVSGRKPSN